MVITDSGASPLTRDGSEPPRPPFRLSQCRASGLRTRLGGRGWARSRSRSGACRRWGREVVGFLASQDLFRVAVEKCDRDPNQVLRGRGREPWIRGTADRRTPSCPGDANTGRCRHACDSGWVPTSQRAGEVGRPERSSRRRGVRGPGAASTGGPRAGAVFTESARPPRDLGWESVARGMAMAARPARYLRF